MLYYRQKILLALLEAFDGSLRSTEFQKYLFLFSQGQIKEQNYHFVPYKYGCFSFQSYKDKQYLIDSGYLEDQKEWILKNKDKKYRLDLKKDDYNSIICLKNKFKNFSRDELIRHVYLKYPYYTLRSEIKNEILTDNERIEVDNIINLKYYKPQTNHKLFTIGYEGLSIEEYLNKLIINDIKVLCDVRKNPISRKFGFSKSILADTVGRFGIKYLHIPELGIESSNRKSLNTLNDYNNLFEKYKNTVLVNQKQSLSHLYNILKDDKRIALTCFELSPEYCHRTKIAQYFKELPDWEYELEEL